MRQLRIPKKRSGGYRTVYAPNREEKAALRALLPALEVRLGAADVVRVAHGCVPGRSPVSNAAVHVGKAWTVCFDLRDFFPSVTADRVPDLPAEVWVDGAAQQGLPTSPLVANLAAIPLDQAILAWANTQTEEVVYSRYVDDLSLSCDSEAAKDAILREIPTVVEAAGWTLAQAKTHVQSARHGRRHVCGVAVDADGVYATRAARRRARAAAHRARLQPKNPLLAERAAGHAEWCALRPPRQWTRAWDDLRKVDQEIAALYGAVNDAYSIVKDRYVTVAASLEETRARLGAHAAGEVRRLQTEIAAGLGLWRLQFDPGLDGIE